MSLSFGNTTPLNSRSPTASLLKRNFENNGGIINDVATISADRSPGGIIEIGGVRTPTGQAGVRHNLVTNSDNG